MNALKQELEIDDHKIPIQELYKRLKTHPENVSFLLNIIIGCGLHGRALICKALTAQSYDSRFETRKILR